MKTKKHGYTFTTKSDTTGGIISTILAGIAILLLITGIVISYQKKGNAGMGVGLIGTLTFVISMTGMIFGLRSFGEKNGFYLFSWIGTICNTLLWIFMCGVIVVGMT